MSRRPLVAISEGFADYGDYYGYAYPRPLLAAGAFPVLLPYLEDRADRIEAIRRIDGLVLAGGRDIEHWRYGRAEPHPEQPAPAAGLDEIELDCARLAVDDRVPLLGICRGCQILNVAFGGTLYGDMDEYPAGGADHSGAKWDEWAGSGSRDPRRRRAAPAPHPPHRGEAGDDPRHTSGGAVRGRQLPPPGGGAGRRRARGGGVGAARRDRSGRDASCRRFVLGVQWELHEEWQADDRMLGIWRAFVTAARLRMDEREGVPVP
jgi:gamma-glutamyl-gamma-aminobutyrate hydrolase PuuD